MLLAMLFYHMWWVWSSSQNKYQNVYWYAVTLAGIGREANGISKLRLARSTCVPLASHIANVSRYTTYICMNVYMLCVPSQQKLCRYVYFYTRQTWICRLWRTRIDAAHRNNKKERKGKNSSLWQLRGIHVGDWRVEAIMERCRRVVMFTCIRQLQENREIVRVECSRQTPQSPRRNHSCAVECECTSIHVRTTFEFLTQPKARTSTHVEGVARKGMVIWFMIMLMYRSRYGGWRVRAYKHTERYIYICTNTPKHLNGHKKDVTHNCSARCVSVSWCSWILIGKTCVESGRVAYVFLFT